MSEILKTLRDAAEDFGRAATHPEILLALAATQAACSGKIDTANTTDMACAQALEGQDDDADDITGSNRVGLTEEGYVGYTLDNETGLMCIVKAYTAWDPSTLENLSGEKVDKLLAENLMALTYASGSSFSQAAEEENLGKAYLSDSAEDFDLAGHDDHGGNVFAAVCPNWEGTSELVITDLCRYIVSVNGDSYDTFPDVPECIETHYPDVDFCED